MKQMAIFLSINIIILFLTLTSSTTLNNSNKLNLKLLSKESNKPSQVILPEGDVLWEGWVKYFHYSQAGVIKRPNQFYVNNQFFKQTVKKSDKTSKDDKGYKFIQNKFNFYIKMLKGKINIVSSRNDKYSRIVDTLNMDLIRPIDPIEPEKGSVRNMGTYEEGSCVSISALKPTNFDKDYLPISSNEKSSKPETWVFCINDKTQQEVFYAYLLTYRLLRQEQQGMTLAQTQKDKKLKLGQRPSPPKEYYTGFDAQPAIDGYLVLVNDWTQCSLKCGSGISVQQWRCIPPKTGGKECQGKLIREKKCNTKPCPGVTVNNGNGSNGNGNNNEETVNAAPIFKSMPFIERPQQDIPCVIRENDVMYEIFNKKANRKVKMPGRLLMNNRTISVYEDDHFDKSIFTFKLSETKMNSYDKDHCCFFFSSNNQRVKLCGLGGDCGSESKPDFLNSWKYSFQLFKKKCYHDFEVDKMIKKRKNENENDNNNLSTPDLALGQMNVQQEDVEARQKVISDKLSKKKDIMLESRAVKSEKLALRAITRELNLEERLQREEMLKANSEAQKLVTEMKKEEEKKEKLEEALEEKEDEEIKVRDQRKANIGINHISQEAEETILSKREELKRKITNIRKKAERRKKLINQKIKVIRGKMAQDLVQANKSGSIKTCKNAKDDQKLINAYCDVNKIESLLENKECKDIDNFCYVCCESEFGNIQVEKRDSCYSMCDMKQEKKIDLKGDWAWK